MRQAGPRNFRQAGKPSRPAAPPVAGFIMRMGIRQSRMVSVRDSMRYRSNQLRYRTHRTDCHKGHWRHRSPQLLYFRENNFYQKNSPQGRPRLFPEVALGRPRPPKAFPVKKPWAKPWRNGSDGVSSEPWAGEVRPRLPPKAHNVH